MIKLRPAEPQPHAHFIINITTQLRQGIPRTTYSDGTSPREGAYNYLGQLTQVIDDAGVRTFTYGEVRAHQKQTLNVRIIESLAGAVRLPNAN